MISLTEQVYSYAYFVHKEYLNINYLSLMSLGTLTISIDDDIEKKLRELVTRLYGSRKGGLSNVIESALKSYFTLLNTSVSGSGVSFKALKDDTVVAEANTLDDLADILKKRGIEPRGLRIISSKRIRPMVHSGYRISRA